MRYFSILILTLISSLSFGQPTQTFLDSTNIPLVLINTLGKDIVDDPKIVAAMKIIYNGIDKYNFPEDAANIYNGNVGIELRGRYSQGLPQKPYGFETIDGIGNNFDVSLFGFPAENDWILLANYNDKSFVRNSLIFYLFRKMGHYAPRTQHCEVIVNDDYQGIYVFTEKIKRDKGRVNISKMDIDDNAGDSLTGGYIFKIDYMGSNDYWTSHYTPVDNDSVQFVYTYPDPKDITITQRKYLSHYVDGFENVLFGDGFKDASSGYRKYVDVNSFVDYFIISEITRNIDAYKKSCFYYKKADSKGGLIYAGPAWDFDWAMKNFWECFCANIDGSGWAYQIHQCTMDQWDPMPPAWITRMITDPYFSSHISERYTYLRKNVLSNNYIFNYIDSTKKVLDSAQVRHYKRWPILGLDVGTSEMDAIPDSYEGEVEKLKNWFSLRLAWLDENIPKNFGTGIPEIIADSENGIEVYPNPATSEIHIQSIVPILEMRIYSLDGKLVQSAKADDPYFSTINIRNLSPGYYIIRSLSTDNRVYVDKLIKK
jgi:hypothetical protein